MTVEPKPENASSEMTSEEAQMALALIRALEAQVRNLEKQIADINEQVGRQPGPGEHAADEGAGRKQY